MSQLTSMWLPFNIMEGLLALIAALFHISGMLVEREPLPHLMYFCGSYCAFLFISVSGIVGVYYGFRAPIIIQVIVSASGAILFLTTAIFSMYYAEKDFHLMYLSDKEEAYHPYFMANKAQSITSLFATATYFLHFTLAIDALVITDDLDSSPIPQTSNSMETNEYSALKPLKTDLTCWSHFLQFEICQKCVNAFSDIEEKEDYDGEIELTITQSNINSEMLRTNAL